jgi:hypothetical protein
VNFHAPILLSSYADGIGFGVISRTGYAPWQAKMLRADDNGSVAMRWVVTARITYGCKGEEKCVMLSKSNALTGGAQKCAARSIRKLNTENAETNRA